jgi:hypothetical protein
VLVNGQLAWSKGAYADQTAGVICPLS